MTPAEELEALRRTVKRLQIALAVVGIVAAVGTGLAASQRFTVPEALEVRTGSRSARLTPNGLVIKLDGEQRAVLDAHSGVIVRDASGHVAQLSAGEGVQLVVVPTE